MPIEKPVCKDGIKMVTATRLYSKSSTGPGLLRDKTFRDGQTALLRAAGVTAAQGNQTAQQEPTAT